MQSFIIFGFYPLPILITPLRIVMLVCVIWATPLFYLLQTILAYLIRFHSHLHLSCTLHMCLFSILAAAMLIPIFIPSVVGCACVDVQHVLQMDRLRKQTEERQEEMMQRSQTEADMLSEEL